MVPLSIRVAVVGDLVFDIMMWGCGELGKSLVCSDSYVGVGGSSNILIALSRLGVKPYAVGCVGDDLLGDECVKVLTREGIDCGFIDRCGRTSLITSFEVGGRVQYRAFINRLLSDSVLSIDWGLFDAVIFNANTLADELSVDSFIKSLINASRNSRVIVKAGVMASRLVELIRRHSWLLRNLTLIINREGLINVAGFGSVSDALLKLNELIEPSSNHIIATLGGRGCAALINGLVEYFPTEPVNASPHEEVGAGDVFTAALTACIVKGYGVIDECVEFASCLARCKVMRGLIGCEVMPNSCVNECMPLLGRRQ